MKIIFMMALLLSGAFAQAQESSITTEAPKATEYRHILGDFRVLVAAFPIPLFSEGVGAAVEYSGIPHFAPEVTYMQESRTIRQGGLLGGEDKAKSKNYYLGFHAFQRARNSGIFLAAGYKWSQIHSDTARAIFDGPPASTNDRASGVYGGLGYRFLRAGPHFTWMIDAGANYEPGFVKSMHYFADKRDSWGLTTAGHVETVIGYDFFPKARFGVSF